MFVSKFNKTLVFIHGLLTLIFLVGMNNGFAADWKTVTIGEWLIDVPDNFKLVTSKQQTVFISHNPDMITMLDFSQTSINCRDFLETTRQQTLKQLENPVQQQLMQLAIMPVDISGRDGLISEGGTRTPEEVQKGMAMRPISILTLCVGPQKLFTVNQSLRQGELTDKERTILKNIAESVRPQRKKTTFQFQPTIPQPTIPQPSIPQPSIPQPTIPQSTIPQPSISQPTIPQIMTPQPAYKVTCPKGVKNCSPDNLCHSCDSSCGYCQNLDVAHCGSNDCMTCRNGKELQQLYDDGTGRCL